MSIFPLRARATGAVTVREDPEGAVTRAAVVPRPRGTGYLPYRYDIHGIVTVGSQVRLPELEVFRAPSLGRDYDISVRIGSIGRDAAARRRTEMLLSRDPRSVCYIEQIGRLGANFVITMGSRIEILASPLLACSRHVLYTNVLEALLRFVLVSRGYMLLHSACLDMGGRGVLLSARTDTGKTGTVLRLLREHPDVRFLSDDMTVLSPTGTAYSYAKPLTISQHTLRSVDPGDLRRLEWQVLRVKGRVHSREGRAVGLWLGRANIPIMAVNSLTQIVLPPPKYAADRLVPCERTDRTQVGAIYVIERGTPSRSPIPGPQVVDQMIQNTDDAYGFPPFKDLAPVLVLGDDNYESLRRHERRILEAAICEVPAVKLASDTFGWADVIARDVLGRATP
ncbi:MAG: hypothetical protein ACOYXW_08305 [Actinomycetota bacterium]